MQTHKLLGAAFGIYFISFIAIPMFGLPKLESYSLITIFGALTSLLAFFQSHFDVPRTAVVRWSLLLVTFLGIIGGSYTVNLSAYDRTTALKVLGYVSLFLIASTPTVTQGVKYLRPCLIVCWMALLVSMLIILGVNNRNENNGRLIGPYGGGHVGEIGLRPNDVGQISMVAVALAPIFGWRGVLITLPLGIYTAYLANSRGSLLGILLAFMTFVLAREVMASSASLRRGEITWRGLTITCLVFGAAVILPVLTWSFISEDVLRIGDAKRGIGSGFTGRIAVWEGLWQRWQEKPLLGYGYGIVKDEALEAEATTDGGYLMVMAELGVLGIAYFVAVFGLALLVSLKAVVNSRSNLSVTLFVYIATFSFVNVLESRIVGTGSIGLGIFFLISSLCVVDSESIVKKPGRSAWLRFADGSQGAEMRIV